MAGAISGCGAPLPIVPDFVDYSLLPAPARAPYVLHYGVGTRHRVSNTFGHYAVGNQWVGLYAVDFPMPIDTPESAMRGGTVVALEERFADGGRAVFHENCIMIRHADDTVGRYFHFTQGGALVDVGERVGQGPSVSEETAAHPPHLTCTSTCRRAGPTSHPATTTSPAA